MPQHCFSERKPAMENPTNTDAPNQSNVKPNIILITVDQLRFPMHFQSLGINSADEFVAKYMPNLFKYLWKDGVKFSNYYTAASDCTASRATIHTGLYGYQTYSMLTLISAPPSGLPQPSLEPEFPTIGRLMREQAQYKVTPYFGKWHLSYQVSDLEKYGYTSYTPNQDYWGYAGQGLATDDTPAWEAAHWINNHVAQSNADPFFLTLNFVNPHDKQWFWGAMQADNFYKVYAGITSMIHETPPGPYIQVKPQDNPPFVYQAKTKDIRQAIPNFQDQLELNQKPKTQTLVKEVFQYQMGGIYEEDEKEKYTPVNEPPRFSYAYTPVHPPNHKAIAPDHYWVMALDSYVQVMGEMDNAIGNFMSSLTPVARENVVFIFTSDHGEYGSSHGLQGKGGTVYDEGIRIPLVVRDQTNSNFAKSPEVERKQLTSSVDLLRMIVTMGCGGTSWMTGNPDYQQMYGNRCDLLNILANPNASGRTYALHSTDEFVPDAANFNKSNLHVIGLIQTQANGSNKTKLGVYTTWRKEVDSPKEATVIKPLNNSDIEFYDVNQPNEMASTPTSSAAQTALGKLFGASGQLGLVYSELQAPLPNKALQDAQTHAYHELMRYMDTVNALESGIEPPKEVSEELKARAARVWVL
jgi:uncharacterized sulfatase